MKVSRFARYSLPIAASNASDRQRVVEVASSLFRERGLNGIGVVDIMAAAGLTHGGFYRPPPLLGSI
jgi:AcrR family transcriptional regulator